MTLRLQQLRTLLLSFHRRSRPYRHGSLATLPRRQRFHKMRVPSPFFPNEYTFFSHLSGLDFLIVELRSFGSFRDYQGSSVCCEPKISVSYSNEMPTGAPLARPRGVCDRGCRLCQSAPLVSHLGTLGFLGCGGLALHLSLGVWGRGCDIAGCPVHGAGRRMFGIA
jgi:hypothetical protein